MNLRTLIVTAGVVVVSLLAAADAAAQPQQPGQQPSVGAQTPALPDPSNVSAGQIQRWFEAFMVLQAQDALQLSEAQYGRFVTRLKTLQEVRRRQQQTRNKALAEMRRAMHPQTGSQDEAQIAELLKGLRASEDRAAAELTRAYEAVDETLDVRQQARFRIFEERMEHQKLELLMRARQNARAARGGRKQ